jgi:hypothetical protein
MNEREEIQCALETCTVMFTPRVHNQRFHDRECCRVYTNARILAAYHAKKNRKMTGRTCKKRGCGTHLSRYNQGELCATHEEQAYQKKLKDWGWEVDGEGHYRIP